VYINELKPTGMPRKQVLTGINDGDLSPLLLSTFISPASLYFWGFSLRQSDPRIQLYVDVVVLYRLSVLLHIWAQLSEAIVDLQLVKSCMCVCVLTRVV